MAIDLNVLKNKLKKEDKEYLLSEESAQDELVRLLKFYDIDIDRFMKDKQTEQGGENVLNAIVEYLRLGKIELKTEGAGLIVTHYLKKEGEKLEYTTIQAKHKRQMDKCEVTGYSKIYEFMGALCGLGADAINKLHANDLAVVENLGALFLWA